jgi:hypothetical protein
VENTGNTAAILGNCEPQLTCVKFLTFSPTRVTEKRLSEIREEFDRKKKKAEKVLENATLSREDLAKLLKLVIDRQDHLMDAISLTQTATKPFRRDFEPKELDQLFLFFQSNPEFDIIARRIFAQNLTRGRFKIRKDAEIKDGEVSIRLGICSAPSLTCRRKSIWLNH